MLIVKVAVENTSYHFDIAYDYLVSDDFLDKIKPGCRVLVPFGGGNRKRQGIVISCEEKFKIDDNFKYVIDVIDEIPILNNEMLELLIWMKDRYFCTFFDIIKVMIPAGIQYEIYHSYKFAGDFNEILESNEFNEDEKSIVSFLAQKNKFVKYETILKNCRNSCSLDRVNKLVKNGILVKVENTIRKLKDAKLKMVRVKENIKKLKLSNKQQLVYDFLMDISVSSVKEICYFTGVTTSVIDSLVKKELAEYFEQEVYRLPFNLSKKNCIEREILLTNEQEKVYNNLVNLYLSGKASVSLLHGITGSGKTLVYMKLIDRVLNDNKSVIVMVPEISLTPQLLEQFISRYGEKVAIFHSAISMGERLDEWKKVKNGNAKVIIGTRSAIFAPVENIGLIVIDEEQEYTYKSEFSPRFHARDIAKFRCNYNNSLLLLSSATPSLESYYLAQKGVYSLNKLSNRYSNARLPKVTISDMNEELFMGNSSEFSLNLINALKENFEKGEQSILLLNRRGHNTFISCRKCGEVIKCPNCSISMTYHSANNKLICHYCGYSVDFTDTCPSCGEKYIKYSGAGTQKIQSDLENILPNARILRMDADSTMSKHAYEKKFKMFEEKKYDIMIGTQMVAKGLNFPDVTLVGVVLADQSLYSDDFRSYERTFDLITQIVGRAGRGEKEGKAIIQTFTPENPIIRLAASQDYEKFYSEEISLRKAMLYPPFVDICVVGFKGSNEFDVQKISNSFFYKLKQEVKSNFSDFPIRIFTPSKASVFKINGKYRFKILIKCKNNKMFREMMSSILIDFQKNLGKCKVNIYIDINPDIIN